MRTWKLLGFVGWVALCSSPGRADSLDDTISSLMATRHVPGMSVAIIDGGKIIRARGYGVTARDDGKPVTVDTLFQAGSISKPVAALGALLLARERQIPFDSDINETMKSWQVPAHDFKHEKITLLRLLNHSAGMTVHGFPGYSSEAEWPSLRQVLEGTRPANTAAIRVDLQPGTRWRYSGGGYTIVQQWMIDVAGQPFPDYMKRAVLVPLGMTGSTYEQPLPAGRADRAAHGHFGRKSVPGRWHGYPEMAAAGLWTTATDLAKFAIAMQQALAAAEGKIPKETARTMVTPGLGGFGHGLGLSGKDSSARFTHGGRDAGFDATFVAYSTGGKGAVVLINTNDNFGTLERVVGAIAESYDWPDYPRSKRSTAVVDREPEIAAKIQQIYDAAIQGNVATDLFLPPVAAAISRRFKGELAEYLKEWGQSKSIKLVELDEKKREFTHEITTERAVIMAKSRFNADGKINGFSLQPN